MSDLVEAADRSADATEISSGLRFRMSAVGKFLHYLHNLSCGSIAYINSGK
jgi:hypothetical protein